MSMAVLPETDRVLEKPRALHLDLKAVEGDWAEFEHREPQSQLLQWHTSSNWAIPPNSAYEPS